MAGAMPVGGLAGASPWGAAIQAGGQVLTEAMKGDAKSGAAQNVLADAMGMFDNSGWIVTTGSASNKGSNTAGAKSQSGGDKSASASASDTPAAGRASSGAGESVPVWVWLAAGGVVVVALLLKKKGGA